MKLTPFPLTLFLAACAAMAETDPTRAVEDFFAAADSEAAMACFHPELELHFHSTDSPALGWEDVRTMLGWDYSQWRSVSHEVLAVDGRVVTVRFREQNEFTRLLDHPGFAGRVEFTVAPDGRIRSELLVPEELPQGTQTIDEALHPAWEWAAANEPHELAAISREDQPVYTADSARRWIALLRRWRADTNRPPID